MKTTVFFKKSQRVSFQAYLKYCFIFIIHIACSNAETTLPYVSENTLMILSSHQSDETTPQFDNEAIKATQHPETEIKPELDTMLSDDGSFALLKRPPPYTNDSQAVFSFTSTTNGVFFCSFDGKPLQKCESPILYQKLEEQSHSFFLKFEKSKNSTITYDFTVDYHAPELTLINTRSFLPTDFHEDYLFESDEKSQIWCALQNETIPYEKLKWEPCSQTYPLLKLSPGSYIFRAYAEDNAGNKSEEVMDGFIIQTPFEKENFAILSVKEEELSRQKDGKYNYDIIDLHKRFYDNYSDRYDFILSFTNFPLGTEHPFAASISTRLDEKGIGLETMPEMYDFQKSYEGDISHLFGSKGELDGVIMMNHLEQYPQDPFYFYSLKGVNDQTGTLSPLYTFAHEFGHHWLVNIRYPSPSDSDFYYPCNDAQGVHWNFYFNSLGSPLKGNHIIQVSKNQFSTLPLTYPHFYSTLDMYLMGFIPKDQVKPTFYIEDPIDDNPYDKTRQWQVGGLTITGTKHEVSIETIVQMNGERYPDFESSQKHFRIAFIVFTLENTILKEEDRQKIEAYRKAFQSYIFIASKGHATIDTSFEP